MGRFNPKLMQNAKQGTGHVISLRYIIYHKNTVMGGKCGKREHTETQAELDGKSKLAGDVGSFLYKEGITTGSRSMRETGIIERTLQ